MYRGIIEKFGEYDEEEEPAIGYERQVKIPGIESGGEWKEREIENKPIQYENYSGNFNVRHNVPQQTFPHYLFNPGLPSDFIGVKLIPLSAFPERPEDKEYSEFRESYKKWISIINEFNQIEKRLPDLAETKQAIRDKRLIEAIFDIEKFFIGQDLIKNINKNIDELTKLINSNIKSKFWEGWKAFKYYTETYIQNINNNKKEYINKLNKIKVIINDNINELKALEEVGGEDLKYELLSRINLKGWISNSCYEYVTRILSKYIEKELGHLNEAENGEELYKKITEYMPELLTYEKMHLRGYYGEKYIGGIKGKIKERAGQLLDRMKWDNFVIEMSRIITEEQAKKLIIKGDEGIIKELGEKEIVKKFFFNFLVSADYDPHEVEGTKGGETGIVERKIEKLRLEKDPELIKFIMWLLKEKGIKELRDRMIDLTWRLGEKLGKKDLNNLIKIYKQLEYYYDEWNELDVWVLVAGIRGIETIGRDIRVIEEVSEIVHNNASRISEEIIAGIMGTKNVTKLVKDSGGVGLNIVRKYYELMTTILGNGGMSGILDGRGRYLKELEKRGAIKPGFKERMEDFADIIRMGIDINPSKKNYGELVLLINELTSDVETLINYEKYLKYYKEAKKKDEGLYLLNMDLGNGLRFRVLRDLDPGHFRVGIETDCCQRIGGAAETSVVDSFINPVAGVLVLEGASGEIIAQSWIHYIAGEGYILDNIEVATRYEGGYKGKSIEEIYAYWARHKKAELGVRYIQAGSGYSDISGKKFEKIKMEEDPRTFAVENAYTDWDAGEENIDLTAPKFEVGDLSTGYDKVGGLIKIFERLTKSGRVDNLGRNVKSWGSGKV